MKNTVLALIAFLAMSVSAFAQDNETKSSFAYSNITEFGFFTTSPISIAFEATTVQGFSIDKKHHLGLGFGIGGCIMFDSYWGDEEECAYTPIFVNYRYYFNPGKSFSPHINAALGGLIATDGGGIYSAITMGFLAGKFSFSSGFSFLFVTEKDWYGDLVGYFPLGITIKCGFSF